MLVVDACRLRCVCDAPYNQAGISEMKMMSVLLATVLLFLKC